MRTSYHEKWKAISTAVYAKSTDGDARRGRDLTLAKVLMSELGSQLPYALPGESKKSESGESEEKMADEIVREALIGAPRALRATKKKVLALKKEDHAFSYYTHRAAPYSQGMPVCKK